MHLTILTTLKVSFYLLTSNNNVKVSEYNQNISKNLNFLPGGSANLAFIG